MKWIETKKQLPKHKNKVLIVLFGNRKKQQIIEIGYLCETEKTWFGFDNYPMEDYGFFVTHWMKLPDKPKLLNINVMEYTRKPENIDPSKYCHNE